MHIPELASPAPYSGAALPMSHATISFLVLGAAVVLFVSNRLPPEIVALGAALAMYAFGVIRPEQVLVGFGDPAVMFIASLFVVSEALDSTGVTAWMGQQLIDRVGSRHSLLLVSMLGLVALVSALITPNGSVAALLPVGVAMALRTRRAPSSFLLPLAFAASAGSMLALTGSPVNVIVSEAAATSAHDSFSYLSFALVGIPLVLGTIAITTLLGERLVPERHARTMPPDLSEHARTLADQYTIDQSVMDRHDLPEALITRESGVAEVIIPPRSELIGERVFPGMVTSSGDLILLAVQRSGEDRDGETTLGVGDTLLLQGEWGALDENLDDPEVLVVDRPQTIRRQAVPLGPGAKRAIAVVVAMVILLATGAVPAFVASLLAACVMIVLRVLTVEQAYRSVSWTTVVLIGAMFAVSVAIKDSGAAAKIADALVNIVGGAGPHVLLIGLFVLTAVFGQLISNTATALIVIPIAVSAATDLNVSTRPVLMSVAVAAAASFLTPIATPANMMVMGPGGYRFGDYWKLGLCVLALFFVVAVFLVPLFWSF
jgi:di/tricarboxylate transporter